MNPRVAMNDLSVFKTDLFGHLSTPPRMRVESIPTPDSITQKRGFVKAKAKKIKKIGGFIGL